MNQFAAPLAQLISQLGKLPSIGGKSAQRLAFHLMSIEQDEALALADAIIQARRNLQLCPICCNLTDQTPCPICSDADRDPGVLCVVETPTDLMTLEKARSFNGRYHVLHGAISPMNNIGPEQIKLKELLVRLSEDDRIKEVFLANSSTTEGEATALYISRLLKAAGIKTTRLAKGLPMGSRLEFADEVTLSRAIEGRTEI